jgi:cephalosporin hydroxylase
MVVNAERMLGFVASAFCCVDDDGRFGRGDAPADEMAAVRPARAPSLEGLVPEAAMTVNMLASGYDRRPVVRPFKTAFNREFLEAFQHGILHYQYRGIWCIKCPIDLAIYSRLVWDLKPGCIIEIGSYQGGSALWFADTMTAFGLHSRVVSIDINVATSVSDPRIQFLRGDARDLRGVLTDALLDGLPKPWIVVEDGAHTYETTIAALSFFGSRLSTGDFLVVEDGVIDDLGLSEQFDGGPNRAVKDFLERNSDRFSLATEYCDMFGTNATYNPNGYLRVI